MAEDLHQSGHIDKRTMREFDEACLAPVIALAPEELKAIREREQVSQPVFARYLNVSKTWCPIGKEAPNARAAPL